MGIYCTAYCATLFQLRQKIKMTEVGNEAVAASCCASCGIAEIDDIKLLPCDGCDLVKYCSDDCKNNHQPEHEEACKKRVAELRDELLFKQPESTHKGDCPICCVPLPLEETKSGTHSCCGKVICHGCVFANAKRAMELRIENTCAFCREPIHMTEEEDERRRMKRIEANDPRVMSVEGWKQCKKGEYSRAFDYWTKAAELGDAQAHYQLSELYHDGNGVEQDEGKEKYHLEEAAIGGHPPARYHLGINEWMHGNEERAVKHWVIAAKQGEDDSMKMLVKTFKTVDAIKKKIVGNDPQAKAIRAKCELISKEVLADTLRAHKAAVDATKSKQRDKLRRRW